MKPPVLVGGLLLSIAWAQTAPPSTPPPGKTEPGISSTEMNTHEEAAASFKSHVNMVVVPVVVRDHQGVAIGNLTKENFQLFDKGKPQEITRFAMEKVGSKPPLEPNGAPAGPPLAPSPADDSGRGLVIPERFVAFLFDDVHISAGDLIRIREAAERHLAKLQPTDRAAIFTMSGIPTLDFTDDQARLREVLYQLRPNIMARQGAMTGGETLTFGSLDAIKNVVKYMNSAPGQRSVVIVSPGFMTMNPMYFSEKSDIMDFAIRSNVVINAMDGRGLYTDPALDASRGSVKGSPGSSLIRASMQSDVLAELADGTGGTFFHNSNDYDEAFRRLAATPEYVYTLGFLPQNLKNDGSFHGLRVTIKPSKDLTVQARHGYYAPKGMEDPAETARQEIESALFSREELRELPIDLHTQFFKISDLSARITVLARLGLNQFKYRRVDDRNNNQVTLVIGLFDRSGHYLQGVKKVIELRLKDETLAKRLNQGAVVRSSFDVPPGTYLVRLVVRDAEGQLMSATNGAVQVPI